MIDVSHQAIALEFDGHRVPAIALEAEGTLAVPTREPGPGPVEGGLDKKMIRPQMHHGVVVAIASGHQADLFGLAELEVETDQDVAVFGFLEKDTRGLVGALAEQDTVVGPPVPGEVPPGTDVARREVIGEIELTGIGDQGRRGPPGRDLFAPRDELGSQLVGAGGVLCREILLLGGIVGQVKQFPVPGIKELDQFPVSIADGSGGTTAEEMGTVERVVPENRALGGGSPGRRPGRQR